MNIDMVAALIGLMESSALSVLEVENNGLRVRMECDRSCFGASSAHSMPAPRHINAIGPKEQEAQPALSEDAVEEESRPKGRSQITSPMVGTFHEVPNRSVAIGQQVRKGEPVCIVEAMKVMNEIVMEEDGVVTWIAAQEGDMVEFGQVLFLYD